MRIVSVAAAGILLSAFAAPAQAATLMVADFSGTNGISGSFTYDPDAIPAAGSTFTNIFYENLGSFDSIDSNDWFSIDFAGQTFTAAQHNYAQMMSGPGIQYRGDEFNGLVFVTNYWSGSNYYEFRINGRQVTVKYADPATGYATSSSLMSGNITYGNAALTDVRPFDAVGAVPEPSTWAMLIFGFGAVGFSMRRQARVKLTYAEV